MTGPTLQPVFHEGYRGHLLKTCRGWRVCAGEDDRTLGYFESKDAAIAALLDKENESIRE
jgi:hypothetical protein